MIAVLKWTAIAWLGVMTASAACVAMFVYEILLPLAWIVGSVLLPIILAPLFVLLMVTPATAPIWVSVTVAGIALYLWLLGLVCLGFIVKAWNELRGPSVRSRWPSTALY